MTGGHATNSRGLNSTEILSADSETGLQKFRWGHDLPVGDTGMNGHCIARVDEDHIFLAGGNVCNTYLVDERSFAFYRLPDLPYLRYRPACSVVRFNNRTVYMVAGGINYIDKEAAYTTDIFDPEMFTAWQPGPWIDGAHKWSNGGYVTYNDEIMLRFSYEVVAFHYNCSNALLLAIKFNVE